MNHLKPLLGPMRVPFLILTPACVLLGVGTAVWESGHVNWIHAVLILIGAVCTHISVNAFNEYFDFKSGLDSQTSRTPFSGGSGTLPARPELARPALWIAGAALALALLIGLYFLSVRGLALLPLGLAGAFVIVTYTTWWTRHPLLCLVAPGLGFGPFMVMGTHFVLTGQYSWTAFVASLVPFFLVSDLLLLNQFPDVEADRSIGRKHLPIVAGRQASSLVYGAFLLLAYLALVVGVCLHYLPPASLLGLLTVFLAVPVSVNAYRYAEDIAKLIPAMGLNVIINIATPVLVAVGLLIG
ncbi:MAG: prenyltransferase [Thermoflexales bacterium]|nr:prenyltransferase [Thermoflexales bacterium]